MKEILWHGRGGQGAFTAARLLGSAYAATGGFALAFPSFGPERRGAPIRAFTKLDKKPIANRSEIEKADFSIFLDDTLFGENALDELKPDGTVIINTTRTFADKRILAIDANKIAEEVLGIPITNTIMLGALSAVIDEMDENDIAAAIKEHMPQKLHEKNCKAVFLAAKLLKEALK